MYPERACTAARRGKSPGGRSTRRRGHVSRAGGSQRARNGMAMEGRPGPQDQRVTMSRIDDEKGFQICHRHRPARPLYCQLSPMIFRHYAEKVGENLVQGGRWQVRSGIWRRKEQKLLTPSTYGKIYLKNLLSKIGCPVLVAVCCHAIQRAGAPSFRQH